MAGGNGRRRLTSFGREVRLSYVGAKRVAFVAGITSVAASWTWFALECHAASAAGNDLLIPFVVTGSVFALMWAWDLADGSCSLCSKDDYPSDPGEEQPPSPDRRQWTRIFKAPFSR